jgi:hypothetical protein
MNGSTAVSCGPTPQQDVGLAAQDQSRIQDELDNAIAQLFESSAKAMRCGDPAGARLYAHRAYRAIKSRTLEHRERLEREAMARID